MWFGQFRWRRRRPTGARHVRYLADLGWFWPRAAGVVLSFLLSAACAVGPDFKPPPAPPVSGYTPEAHLAPTTTANVAGGSAQNFLIGRDIPAEWWKVFHSKEIDALIAEALRANPSLQAALRRSARRSPSSEKPSTTRRRSTR